MALRWRQSQGLAGIADRNVPGSFSGKRNVRTPDDGRAMEVLLRSKQREVVAGSELHSAQVWRRADISEENAGEVVLAHLALSDDVLL